MLNLKDWISNTLFNESGLPMRGRFALSWWEKNHPEKLKRLLSETVFLQEPITIQGRIHSILNGIEEHPKCVRCGLNVRWHQIHRRFMRYCSKTCSNRSTVKTGSKAHIGSEEVRKKIRNTMIEKYGTENYFKTEKFRDDFQKKYQRTSGSQFRLTEKAYEILNNQDELTRLHHIEGLSHTEIAGMYNISAGAVHNAFKKYHIEVLTHPTSIGQKEIFEFVRTDLGFNDAVERDRSVLEKLELDIFVPSRKVAIEYHGVYWHSSQFKLPGQHKYKMKACENHGIRLLQFFDIEWKEKIEIVKSIIRATLGGSDIILYARKCTVDRIDKKTASIFLDETHLQGSKGGSFHYGIFFEKELISVMVFSKPRFSSKFEYEIIRYATKKGCRIIGGASKIFSRFVSEINPSSVVSYADLRYSQGNVYQKIGFRFDHYSHVNYYYLINGKLENRMNWQKDQIKEKLPKFDPNLSEKQNMELNGFYRVYDCGHACFMWGR